MTLDEVPEDGYPGFRKRFESFAASLHEEPEALWSHVWNELRRTDELWQRPPAAVTAATIRFLYSVMDDD